MNALQKMIVEQIRERNQYRRMRHEMNKAAGMAGTTKKRWPNAMTDIERLLVVIDELAKDEKPDFEAIRIADKGR